MKKVIVIGGGIAGLSAGIYAQKAGFESIVYEQHSIPGGECTGWDRSGFHIDGCIHWLTGTKEGTKLNRIWKEIGALDDAHKVHQPDRFATVEYGGERVVLYRDLNKLKAHLNEVSPGDCEEIEKLCAYIEPFFDFEPPSEKPMDLMNIFELVKLMSSMRRVGEVTGKLGKQSIAEYAGKFKNPAIREAIKANIPAHYSSFIFHSSLGTFISGNGDLPEGGSRALAYRIAEKYKSLGGELVLRKEVAEIMIDQGRAVGVRLKDGTEARADYIVPACDTNNTLHKLLGGKYRDKKFAVRYEDEETYPLQTCVYVALKVDADLSSYPVNFAFQTEEFAFEDTKLDMIPMKHYCYEPSFAPEGKSVVVVYFHASYDWWKEKRKNLEQYQAEKSRVAADVISRIEARLPELKGKIQPLDVATPLTYERYCGAYKGSWMSFDATPKAKQLMHSGKIKGLKNLFMAGQWLMPPGGLPAAVLTGKWAIQRICKEHNS